MTPLLYIFGPSTAGKSTLAEELKSRIGNLQIVDFDVIKRQIPSYDFAIHADLGKTMTLHELKVVLSNNSNNPVLLLFPSPRTEDEYRQIAALAENAQYKLVNIELRAPDYVLVERYKHRLASIDPTKKDWKFKTLEEFEMKLREPYYKPAPMLSYDSSMQMRDAIALDIIRAIR